MTRPHRTHEHVAKHAAQRHAKTPEELQKLLEQFEPQYRQRILDRLQPHLTFEPKQPDPQ